MKYGSIIGLVVVMLIAAGLTQGMSTFARGLIELIVFVVYLKTFIIGR